MDQKPRNRVPAHPARTNVQAWPSLPPHRNSVTGAHNNNSQLKPTSSKVRARKWMKVMRKP